MGMKTNIKKEGDTVIVRMDGKLDYEVQEPLKKDLAKIIKESKTDSTPKKIIVDLENLEFVGSSGISAFIQTLKDFNTRAQIKPQYCNVGSEFKKIIKAFDEEDDFQFSDSDAPGKRITNN